MVVPTSWVQSGEQLPDLTLPSLGFEEEGPQKDELDKSIGPNPEEMHPQPEPPDPGTSRHT